MVGFDATMSSEDVKKRSKTETVTRDVHFPLTVPAGEGRTVEETTIVSSIATEYSSAITVKGTVGIEIDPGFWTPNYYLWFDKIEVAFPDAEAISRISRISINTDIGTKILTLPKQLEGNEKEAGTLVEYHSLKTDFDAVATAGLVGFDSEGLDIVPHIAPGIVVSTLSMKSTPPGPSPFIASMNLRIQFAGENPEVPLKKRLDGMERFRALIVINVHPIGNPTPIIYAANFASASFSIPYDPQQIKDLGEAVINQAHDVNWGGKYAIYFSYA